MSGGQQRPDDSASSSPPSARGDTDQRRSRRGSSEVPTLEKVNRYRLELWLLTLFLLVVLAVGLVGVSFVDQSPEWLRDFGGTANAIRVSLVALAAGFAAYAIDKERRLRRLSYRLINERVLAAALLNRLNEVESLGEASRSLGRTLELDEALEAILQIGIDLLEADEGSLMLAEEDALVVAAAVGRARLFTGQRIPLDEGLAGRVARTRQSILVEGRQDGHDERGAGIRCALSVPLEATGELVGVLNLSVVQGRRGYNEYDLRALSMFGEQAAITVTRARSRRRDRVRAELASTMADDLQEPLLKIQKMVNLLVHDSETLSPENRVEALRALERATDSALEKLRFLSGARAPEGRNLDEQ